MTRLMTAVYLALLISPVLALMAITPYVLTRYRRDKIIHVVRCEQLYLMIFFGLCAYFVTMLPFPTMGSVQAMQGSGVQLIPFYCVHDFVHHSSFNASDWTSIFQAMGGSIFLGVVFNVVMLMPLGFFLRSLYQVKARTVLLIGFGVSLFFELTQLSGLFFIYPRPYRVFDVDDLMQNTLGAWLGWLCEPLLRRLIPSARAKQIVRQGGEMSMRRRLVADAVDQVLILLVSALLMAAVQTCVPVLRRFEGVDAVPLLFVCYLAASVGMAGICALWHGRTPGLRITGMQLRSKREHALRFPQLALRMLMMGAVLALPVWIAYFISISGRFGGLFRILCTFASALCAYGYVVFLLTLFLHVVTHGEPMAFDRLSGVHLGFDPNSKMVQDSPHRYSGRLDEQGVEAGSRKVLTTMSRLGLDKKKAMRVQYMTEGILVEWMEGGLRGKPFAVQLNQRLGRKTMIVSVPGPHVPLDWNEDSFLEVLTGTRLSFDLYYTGGANVFAVEVP